MHPNFTLESVTASDFEDLAGIRIASMRESLERVGRFDPERARERLRCTFLPEHTRVIVVGGARVGFFALRPSPDGVCLDHLYILPGHQGAGIGGAVLAEIISNAQKEGTSILVWALKQSDSNRFYTRHGFTPVSESEWDIQYVRIPGDKG